MRRVFQVPAVAAVWGVLLATAGVAAPLQAQSLAPEAARQLDVLLAARVGEMGPGCAVGVGMNGEPVYLRGFGSAVIEHDVPISPSTAFNLGSIAKQFTAYATLQLAREGRISLEDDVRQHLPELPQYDAPIRIRDLLHHTSGLRDYVGLARLADAPVRSPERSMEAFLALMSRQQALNFTPGTRHAYVHSDYNVLGLVLERVTGQRLGDLLAERIWRPLGMTSTRQLDETGGPIPAQALSYIREGSGVRTWFPVGALRGGTDVYSTAEDMLRWYAHLERPAAAERELVATFRSRPNLTSGDTISYVHGIREGNHRGLPVLFRGGHGAYFTADHLTFPEARVTALALCNDQAIDTEALVRDMADLVLSGRFGDVADAEGEATTPAAPGELERLAGVYYEATTPWQQAVFSARDGVLHVGSGDGSWVAPTRRLSEGRYEVGGSILDFVPGPSGRMRLRITWAYGEQPLETLRWDEPPGWSPSDAILEAITGAYYSEEVLHAFEVVRVGDRLLVRRSGRPDVPLVPLGPDVFSAAWGDGYTVGVEVVRERGRVVALDLSDLTLYEKVLRLRFERMGSVPGAVP